MKTSIKKVSNSKVEILIDVSSENLDNYYKKALSELGKDLKIKGFRPGNAPTNIVEERIGKDAILNHAAQIAIQDKYVQIVKENDLEVIERPKVEILKLALGNPLKFKVEAIIMPEIKLPDYREVAGSVKNEKVSIKDKDIEEALKWLQSSRTKLIALDREARKGDFIEIEYSSPQIENNSSKKDGFILGKGHTVPGFEEKLEKMKSGEEKGFSLDVPKDYSVKELAGKEVEFKVKTVSVLKTELPEINDEFAKSLGKFENLASLKKNIEEGLKMEKQKKAKEKLRGEIIDRIINSIKWEMPDSLVQAEKERIFADFKQSFSRNPQVSFEDYLKKTKKSEQEIEKSLLEPAQRNVKTYLILKEISKKENIEVSDQEVEKGVNEILENDPSIKEKEKELDLERLRQYTRERITNERVFQLLEEFSNKS